MNHKYITFTLAAFLPFVSVSCDGGGGGDESRTQTEIDDSVTNSLAVEEIREGDSIFFTSSANVSALVSFLALDSSSGLIEAGDIRYLYTKTAEKNFTIERVSVVDSQIRLTQALNLTLSGDAADSQLGSRIRELIHRDTPNFSPEELVELAGILTPSGANLAVTEDGTLVTLNQEKHTCLVTSTVRDQAQGSMGGTYLVRGDATELAFRKPNGEELDLYRFLSPNDWIPYVTFIFRPDEKVEEGTWSIELSAKSS